MELVQCIIYHIPSSSKFLSYSFYSPAIVIIVVTIVIFFDSSSAGGSSPVRPANATSIDWLGSSAQASKVGPHSSRPSLSTNAAGGSSALELSHPSCRPWERGDLLRRLATFKPSTWFSKPKVSPFFFILFIWFCSQILFFCLFLCFSWDFTFLHLGIVEFQTSKPHKNILLATC